MTTNHLKWAGDWIDEASVEIAASTDCCDISSSSAMAIAGVIRRYAPAPAAPAEHDVRILLDALSDSLFRVGPYEARVIEAAEIVNQAYRDLNGQSSPGCD